MDFIVDFLSNNFSSCIWLAIILVAICPTLEGKIAIPLAMNSSIWGTGAMPPYLALLIAYIGSIIPSYLIMFVTRKLKNRTSGFVTSKILQRYSKRSYKVDNAKSNFKKYMILTGFVAVPLPLTGVWTGSIIAGLTDLNLNYAFLSIAIGSLISSSAITLLCTLFTNSIGYILIISLIIIIVFLFVDLFVGMFKAFKKRV